MNALPQPWPSPESFDQSPSIWVDEAIWGPPLYDEQLPWFVFLEFLNVFTHEDDKGRAFDEQGKPNELKYRAAHRLYLRNILFNNPHLPEILMTHPNDSNRWDEWLRRMKSAATGLNHPEFGFLKAHFHSFEHFCEIVSLVRSNSDAEVGFLSDTRRMNVAMTRARRKLVVIGDSATLSNIPFYRDFIQYAESIGAYRSSWENV